LANCSIPNIFHQIWLGEKAIPFFLRGYSITWKEKHKRWEYMFWNDSKSQLLIKNNFPHLLPVFENALYLTQKVDIIKYVVLAEFGGVYVDFDYECLRSIDDLLVTSICIGLEPRDEALHKEFSYFLGSAFMAAAPKSLFFQKTIERCQKLMELMTPHWQEFGKYHYAMETTGPTLINRVYHDFENKQLVTLFPPEQIGSFRSREASLYRENKKIGYGADKLADAYAIHHFIGSWL